MDTTQRGQFRSAQMDIKELRAFADSTVGKAVWDDESTKHKYYYPVSIDPDRATKEGEKLAVGNPVDETYRLGRFVCASSPQSHFGPWRQAIDFLVPDGTSVVAPLDGVIVEVQEHSNSWGPTEEFRDTLNYLTVGHNGHEYTQYCHLAKNSVSALGLTIGSKVKKGQRIAVVGKTGWTDRDHLHFLAFRNIETAGLPAGSPNYKSLRIRFKNHWLQRLVAR